MDIITGLAALGLIAGIFVTIAGVVQVFGKKVFKKGFLSQHYAPLATGVVLVVVGGVFGGYPILADWYNGVSQTAQVNIAGTTNTQGTTSYQYATFSVTPAVGPATGLNTSTFVLSADKLTFTYPIIAWTTTHTIKNSYNNTFVQPSMKFTLNPQAWPGASTTDLAVVYFEFTPLDQTIYPTAGGMYYFLTTTGAQRNARFNNSAATLCQYGSGQLSTTFGTPITVYCNCTLNTDSVSRVDTTYSPILSTITFHNADHSWSQSYTLSCFLSAKKAV